MAYSHHTEDVAALYILYVRFIRSWRLENHQRFYAARRTRRQWKMRKKYALQCLYVHTVFLYYCCIAKHALDAPFDTVECIGRTEMRNAAACTCIEHDAAYASNAPTRAISARAFPFRTEIVRNFHCTNTRLLENRPSVKVDFHSIAAEENRCGKSIVTDYRTWWQATRGFEREYYHKSNTHRFG